METSEIIKLLFESQEKLRKYAHKLTFDCEMADDLIQETWVKVICNANKYKEDGKFIGWAHTIMHNAFINNIKREDQYCAFECEQATTPFANKEASNRDSDNIAEIKDIYNAIDNLPSNYAKVMRLFISGHKYVEISVIMNSPLGTVKTRINQSRAILKKELKDYLN